MIQFLSYMLPQMAADYFQRKALSTGKKYTPWNQQLYCDQCRSSISAKHQPTISTS
jgi:hypothetical protein